jgi:hypothetical protein
LIAAVFITFAQRDLVGGYALELLRRGCECLVERPSARLEIASSPGF